MKTQPLTLSELKYVANNQAMDIYHRELMLWAANRLEINFQKMDSILKKLEDIKFQVKDAEDVYGKIVEPEHWNKLFFNLKEFVTENQPFS